MLLDLLLADRRRDLGGREDRGGALVLLRRTDEGLKLLEAFNRRCVVDGDLYALVGNEGIIPVGKVFHGNIREGIRLLEEAISRREKEGYRTTADWYRMFLSEVFLQIIAGKEKPPLLTLLRNLPILVKVMFTASSRIPVMMQSVFENPQFGPEGHHAGHAEMILGLLYKAKKKPDLAVQHLIKAKGILSQFGQTPMLARLDTALAELGQ